MPQAALIIGAISSVAGTVMSVKAGRKAARASAQQQEVVTRQSRRQAIRQAQLARASALTGAQGAGAGGGSGALGGIGALSSQLGGQLGVASQLSGLSGQINKANLQGQLGQGLSSIGGSLFNYGQGQGASIGNTFSNLFQPRPVEISGE